MMYVIRYMIYMIYVICYILYVIYDISYMMYFFTIYDLSNMIYVKWYILYGTCQDLDGVQYTVLSDIFLHKPEFFEKVSQVLFTASLSAAMLSDSVGREAEVILVGLLDICTFTIFNIYACFYAYILYLCFYAYYMRLYLYVCAIICIYKNVRTCIYI